MAQFTLHAYDADVWIPEFRGLNQVDESLTPDMRFASEAENVETINGTLQPQAACPLYDGEFEDRVETLASFHRRWYTGSGDHTWYVCCAGGKFYQKQKGSAAPWDYIRLPEGISAFQNSAWSWVTYEINPENHPDTVDVLLLSNADDGMIMIIPPDRPTTWGDLTSYTWGYVKDMTWMDVLSEKWQIIPIETPKKFGVIERYAERIWGAAIPDDPDMLMYSAVYYADDWRAYPDPDAQEGDPAYEGQPEDGAGSIQQPSWDGDKFYALKRFGDKLLAFKKNRIWVVMGVSPGEYTLQEQFGEGTSYFNTIAVYPEKVFMCGDNGLILYDGMSTSPFVRDQIRTLWRSVNKAALNQACTALFQNRLYFAFPINGSATNNAMVVYDLMEGTVLYYKDFCIEAFLPTDDVLYATSSTLPGRILMVKHDSWVEGNYGAACKWVTPWMDFGYKRIQKGGFDLYIVPEVKDTAVTFRISVQTEKKLKTKNYTVQPLTAEQRENHKEHKGKRLHFGGSGRRFRVIIQTDEGAAQWRLIGGLQMVVETDPD